MTDRDRAILRAVQALGDNATTYNLWNKLLEAHIGFHEVFRLETMGLLEHFNIETSSIHKVSWRLTRLGEAAIERTTRKEEEKGK